MTAECEFLLAAAQRRRSANDNAGALVLLEELLHHLPDHAPALLMQAELALSSSPVTAANAAHRVVQSSPDDLQALELLARALSAMGRHDEALRAFQRIADAKPESASAQFNLSVSRLRAGDPHAAIAAAQRGIALDPSRPEGHAALGHAYNVLHDFEKALAAHYKALGLRLNFPDALLGVARAHRDRGEPSVAVGALLRASQIAPQSSAYYVDLAIAYQDFADLGAARESLRKAIAVSATLPSFYSNLLFAMQYDSNVTEAEAAAEARQWGMRQIAAVRAIKLPADRDRDPDRPLRVGYVSSDFYRHPVGWLSATAIMAHDRSRVSLHLYANQTAYDPLTSQLQQSGHSWVPIFGLDDDSVAARIVADRIDILVDLAGHTGGNRLAVFARRPAPIQVTWLGYSATTGLPTMDYMLMDDNHLTAGAEALMVERVVRLPHVRFCYGPPDYAGAVATPPSANGRPVTFGSFNNTAKLNDDVIALWARVLAAVPGSRLLLKWRSLADAILQGRIRGKFGAHGIDAERIQFDGATEHNEMLRQYGSVDIALDPFPFCGGQTSCEALWMGVPVVTLAGSRPFSRQTHAILHAIGRAEWSARDADDYVAIAARLAGDAVELGRIRRALRRQIAASPLCDGPGFARSLECAYRKMWLDYLAGT